MLHSLLGSNARIISAWRTGSNPVEACTLLGAFAIIAKIACQPARIKSLVEFHPRVKWNLFVQRKIVIRKHKGNTVLFYLFFLQHYLFSVTSSLLTLSANCGWAENVFFKIILYGLHLLPIYGWNNLFPLVLIGWVNKKGRNWLKSPQIDYLLTFLKVTYWCYFDFLNYFYWTKSKELSLTIFIRLKYSQVTRERENLHLIDWY